MIEVFYAGKKVQEECQLDDKIQELINRLIHRAFLPGDYPETLHAEHLVCSLHAGEKTRLIYTYQQDLRNEAGQPIPIILELDRNHKYNSKYLDSGVYKAFFAAHTPEFKEAIREETPPSPPTTAPTPKSEVLHIIGKDTIVLDAMQKAVNVPAILEGPPGSGKTCVAYVLLENFAEQAAAGKKVIYLTQSQKLAENINNLWMQSPYYKEKNQDGVTICSYDELLSQFYSGLKFEGPAKESLKKWLLETTGVIGNKLSKKQREEKAEKLYVEFRVISGFANQAEYLEASENITVYPKDQRQEVLKAYNAWREQTTNKFFQEFHPLEVNEPQQFDLVLVDEAQDLSYLQLINLMRLARNKQIVYCVDPKQNLRDNDSKIVFLQNQFYTGENRSVVKPVKLEGSYRCPPQIMSLAREVNELRLKMVPAGKQGAAIVVQGTKNGEISWLDTANKSSLETIENLKHDTNTCIVTDEKNKQELMAKGFSRVYTTEEIKGLQYETVILYQPLSQDIFRQINATLEEIENGARIDLDKTISFGAPLCSLFTAITRSEKRLIIYQTEIAQLKQIISPLKKSQNTQAHVSQPVIVDREKSQLHAKELFDKGLREQAEAILRHEVFVGKDKVEELIVDQFKRWSTAPVSQPVPQPVPQPEPKIIPKEKSVKKIPQATPPLTVEVKPPVTKTPTEDLHRDAPALIEKFTQLDYKSSDLESLFRLANNKSYMTELKRNPPLAQSAMKNVIVAYCHAYSQSIQSSTKLDEAQMHKNEKIFSTIEEFIANYDPNYLLTLSSTIDELCIAAGVKGDHPRYDTIVELAASKGSIEANFGLARSCEEVLKKEKNIKKRLEIYKHGMDYCKKAGDQGKDVYLRFHDGLTKLSIWYSAFEYCLKFREEIPTDNDLRTEQTLFSNTINHNDPALYMTLLDSPIKHLHWDTRDPITGMNSLLMLCQKRPEGYLEIVRRLIHEKHVDLTIQDLQGRSVFVFMVILKDIEGLRLLFSAPQFDFETLMNGVPEKLQLNMHLNLTSSSIATLIRDEFPNVMRQNNHAVIPTVGANTRGTPRN